MPIQINPFKEIKDVSQPPNDLPRKWFSNNYFDLILWFEDEAKSQLYGFQLCYDIGKDEHSLTWRKDSGFQHNAIDDGETAGEIKKSPILIPDGAFPYRIVLDRYLEGISGDEKILLITVYDMLIEYTNLKDIRLRK